MSGEIKGSRTISPRGRLDQKLFNGALDGLNLRLELRAVLLGHGGGNDRAGDATGAAKGLLGANFIRFYYFFKKTTLIGEARSKFCNHYTDQRQSLLDSQETPEKVMLLFLPFKSTLVLQEHHPG